MTSPLATAGIHYAQCWEDADVLLEALDTRPGAVCLSIASAGDNTLSLLTRDPAKVVAVDANPAQLHCLALRIAAFRALPHDGVLELVGARPSARSLALYRACAERLPADARTFWDARPHLIVRGIGTAGKFERYFRIFRRIILPLIHPRRRVAQLLQPRTHAERLSFFNRVWNTWRWRGLFRLFFSRFVMARLGRSQAHFKFVQGSVAERLLDRTRWALTELEPAENPYLQWILQELFTTALPHYLRKEHFSHIRANLDRIEMRHASLADVLRDAPDESYDAFNLSDVFEYLPASAYHEHLTQIARSAKPGARLAYWNMLVPRQSPASMHERIRPCLDRAKALHARDKAWFYSRFVLEVVRPTA